MSITGAMVATRRAGGWVADRTVSPPEVPRREGERHRPGHEAGSRPTAGYVQGYNAQAVVDEGQIVLAAEITNTTATSHA